MHAVQLVISLFFMFAYFAPGTQILFELEDSEVNQVIFVGETDIVMRCSVSSITDIAGANCSIKIKDQKKKVIAENTECQNHLEYTITKISVTHGGLYTCTRELLGQLPACTMASFIDTGHSTVRGEENTTLYLNVYEGGPQCFSNGTEGQPYRVGDLLLMSCFCWRTESCEWVKQVDGKLLKLLDNSKIIHRKKSIQRLLEEYPSSGSTNVTYVCKRQTGTTNGPRLSVNVPKTKSSCEVTVITIFANQSIITNASKEQNLNVTKSPCDPSCEDNVLPVKISPTMEQGGVTPPWMERHPPTELTSLGSLIKDHLAIFILVIFTVVIIGIFVAVTYFLLRERSRLKMELKEMSIVESVYFSNYDQEIYSQIEDYQRENDQIDSDSNICCASSGSSGEVRIQHTYDYSLGNAKLTRKVLCGTSKTKVIS